MNAEARAVYGARRCARCTGPMGSPIGFLCDGCLIARREEGEPPFPTPRGYESGRAGIAENRGDETSPSASEFRRGGMWLWHHSRFVELVEREPELEAWQLAERFGITESQAGHARSIVLLYARRRARRGAAVAGGMGGRA